MRIAPVAEVKAKFSAYLKASEKGPVIVTRNGKPVAVLISMQDQDELERLILAYSPQFQAILKASEKQIEQGEGILHDEFWREFNENHE